jgi:hypothetical protein
MNKSLLHFPHLPRAEESETGAPQTKPNRMSKLLFRLASPGAGITLFAMAWAVLWGAPNALAQPNSNPPERMTYQGFLADGNGNPLGNTNTGPKNYDVIFRIWAEQNGGASALWAEQQTVTVDKGYFSILLGEGNALTSPAEPHNNLSTLFTNATASDRFVEMTVKGIGAGGTDVTIQPRLRLLTSPYSYLATLATKAVTAVTASNATSVDGSAVSTGTIPDARLSSNIARRSGGNTFSGNQDIIAGSLRLDNNQYIQGKNASGVYENFLMPRFTDNVTYMNFGSGGLNLRNNGSTSRMFVSDAGNVGIGTTSPGFKLDVTDRIRLSDGVSGSAGLWLRQSLADRAFLGMLSSDYFGVFGSGSSWGMVMNVNNGNVGIGTSTPATRLDVNGTLSVSGGITTGPLPGHAPVIIEEKTSNNQSTWNSKLVYITPWMNRPGGFNIHIYAQHETSYEVRNFDATVVVQQPGYANDPNASQYNRISVNWGAQGRASLVLGYVLFVGNTCNGYQETYPDGWVKIGNVFLTSAGACGGGFDPGKEYLVVTFHPSVSGQNVIYDN